MAKRYYLGNQDGTKTPYADGTFETSVNFNEETGVLFIAFYDVAGDLVTPDAGSIVVEGSGIEGQWLAPGSGDATIDATKVSAGTATYSTPVLLSGLNKIRITTSGIGNADSFLCFVWRK